MEPNKGNILSTFAFMKFFSSLSLSVVEDSSVF